MMFQRVEVILAVVLVVLALLFLIIYVPGNLALIDWVLPVLGAVMAVAWLVTRGQQQQHRS